MILTIAYPEMTREQLAALSIGERDARLLTVRERTFGTSLDLFICCPRCQQELELSLDTNKLHFPPPSEGQDHGEAYSALIDDSTVRYRLPDSTDMEAIANCQTIDQARQRLLDRCIVEIQSAKGKAEQAMIRPGESYSTDFVAALARHMAEQDPQAEVLMDFTCVECQHQWQSLFDIVSFFWSELETQAKRLLNEVYILARVYHWREQDILALSPTRRKWYLEMATL